ncbi:hypothetical protein [Muricauda sp. MAR_2010_75]|uniref:hypothetical protein n=1 Tax=Allomuricauda sp. MAR_2010_75 TaxID=1250232 RepID=UPI0005684F06|nr:hypothetical protein [Muricauda sp. MAR_2010_75]
MKRLLPILLMLACTVTELHAQKTTKESSNTEESYFLVDLSYMNDALFMGRRDSIAAPYILPSIGYYDKSGLFLDVSASYLTRSDEQRVDLFFTTAGFLFDSNKWSGGASGTAYFYNEDSYNVQSEVVADITGILSYDLKAVELSVYVSSYFNKNSSPDIFMGLLMDHTFYAFNRSLLITPRASVFAGSQYFYQEYYSTSRLGNRKGQGKGAGSTEPIETTTVEIAEASEFNLLNLELSIPLQYHHNHFIFSFTPVWAFPQSSATLTTEDGVFEEELESVFYWSAGISYWFIAKKRK